MEPKKAMAMVIIFILVFTIGFTGGWYLRPEREKAPPTIICLSWGSEWGEATAVIGQNFTSKYGNPFIIDYHVGGSAASIAKLSAQWPNPKWDLVQAAGRVIYEMARNGWMVELNEENFPVLEQIPEVYRITYDGKVYGVGMYVSMYVAVAYRTDVDLPGTPIESWKQLLDPMYAGKIVIGSQAITNTLAKLACWGGADPSNETAPGWVGPGVEMMKELAESGNIGMVYETEADVMRVFATGECPIYVNAQPFHTFPVLKQGVKFNVTRMFNDTAKSLLPTVDAIGVVNGPDPDKVAASIKFLNMFMDPYNNGYYNSRVGSPPCNKYAKIDPLLAFVSPTTEQLEMYGVPISVGIEGYALRREEWQTIWDTEIAPLL